MDGCAMMADWILGLFIIPLFFYKEYIIPLDFGLLMQIIFEVTNLKRVLTRSG